MKDSKKELIDNFMSMRLNAELNVLQKISLERPLSEKEYNQFMRLGNMKLEGRI